MPDFADYPDALQPILQDFSEAVTALMRDFQAGKITLAEWRDKFSELLAMYISAGYLVGSEKDDIVGDAGIWLVAWLALQLDYLNGFRDAIAANLAAGGQYAGAWNNRAQMYVTSTVAPFWYGETEGLPLPAVPGDGSSQCLQMCNCGLFIDWIDHDALSADVRWVLNVKRESEHNCQTCRERAAQWNPLKIRDGNLIMPRSVESHGASVGKEIHEKHLPGQHDQSTHGIRAAGSEKPKYGPDGRPQNLVSVSSYYRDENSISGALDSWNTGAETLVDRLGISEEHAYAWLDKSEKEFRRVCREGEVRTRVTENALEQIIDDGRVKSQFETGTSEGHLDPDARAEAEEKGLGAPFDLSVEDRPIYGYVHHPEAGHDTSAYGDIALCMKPEVKDRTTVTFGDSLSLFHMGRMVGAPMKRADKYAMASHAAFALMRAARMSGVKRRLPKWWIEMEPYIEAQIHGQVRLQDVQKVIFGSRTSQARVKTISQLLDSLGIPWEIYNGNDY